jgi:hypothetical protein
MGYRRAMQDLDEGRTNTRDHVPQDRRWWRW